MQKGHLDVNILNIPVAANTVLLLLGYPDNNSKLYFPKFGDESLGWLPPYTFKGVCWHMQVGVL